MGFKLLAFTSLIYATSMSLIDLISCYLKVFQYSVVEFLLVLLLFWSIIFFIIIFAIYVFQTGGHQKV